MHTKWDTDELTLALEFAPHLRRIPNKFSLVWTCLNFDNIEVQMFLQGTVYLTNVERKNVINLKMTFSCTRKHYIIFSM